MKTFLLVVGVAYLHWGDNAHATPISTNQSVLSGNRYLDHAVGGAMSGKHGADPDLVVSVKYENGLLDEIRLAKYGMQRVQGAQGLKEVWAPSVDEKTEICADLCVAGLGGEPCGRSCDILLPDKLQQIQDNRKRSIREAVGEDIHVTDNTPEVNTSSADTGTIGVPRTSVCPTLCANNLGGPLCQCDVAVFSASFVPSWESVCYTFCSSDGYQLHGCPACNTTAVTHQSAELVSSSSLLMSTSNRILNTAEGWMLWCNVQCGQGEGGAACNCDRAPFRML